MKLAAVQSMVWSFRGKAMGFALAFAVMGLLLVQRSARSCDSPAFEPHRLDPAAQQVDRTAPSLGPSPAVNVHRSTSPQNGCTGGQGSSCDGIGSISITPTVADDRALPLEIGFRLRVLAGSLPEGLTLPNGDVKAQSGTIYFHWEDGNEADHEPFSFTLELIAVDTAGNLSAPVQVVVGDAGVGGCSIGRSSARGRSGPGAFGCLILGCLATLWWRSGGRRTGNRSRR
jgi:hypothetical protein